MQEVNIKIWPQIMEAFVETSMVMAEKSLIDAATRRPQ
jgi:hypothetical protein